MKEIKLIKENCVGHGLLVENDSGLISYDITENNRKIFESLGENVSEINSDGHFFIDCKLQEANVLNRNGRIYPRHVLENQMKIYQKLIDDYAAISEADHPDSIQISLHNLSHRIAKTWWVGDTLYGKLDILVSDSFLKNGIGWTIGDKIALYLQRKIKLGISSRGIGSVKNVNGKNIVQDDFELICFDLVATPSTPNAYLFLDSSNNLNENVEQSTINVKKYDDFIINTLKIQK